MFKDMGKILNRLGKLKNISMYITLTSACERQNWTGTRFNPKSRFFERTTQHARVDSQALKSFYAPNRS